MSLLTTLGLRALPASAPAVPSYAAFFLISNFVSAYLVLAPRHLKQWYGFDHNCSPREDIAKYGEALVKEGKLSRSKLNMIKRWESAQMNATENFPLFVAGTLLGLNAGVDNATLNGLMGAYTLSRLAYAASYILIERNTLSLFRSLFWWCGNASCLVMLVKAGKKL